ncbi:MAG: hypothetical protein ABI253_12915 [Mycobacterium sp.]
MTIPVRIPIVLPLLINAINDFLAVMQTQHEPVVEEPAPPPALIPHRHVVAQPAPVPAEHPIAVGFGIGPGIAGSATTTAAPAGPATAGAALPMSGAEMLGYLVSGGHAQNFGPTLADRDQATSQAGAAPLGFTGAARRAGARSTGLTRLRADAFGPGPAVPLLPETWDRHPDEG